MFPKTSLLLGTSVLWSVTPLVASPLTGGREDLHLTCSDLSAGQLLSDVRQAISAERRAERRQVFEGLTKMFDRGDRRVAVLPEFHSPVFVNGERQIDGSRVVAIVQEHMDLYDEALSLA